MESPPSTISTSPFGSFHGPASDLIHQSSIGVTVASTNTNPMAANARVIQRAAVRMLVHEQVQHHAALVRPFAMFKQIDSLPGSERQTALVNRNGELRRSECGTDVGGHIVRSFGGVPV